MVVERGRGRPSKTRRVWYLAGFGAGLNWGIHNNSLRNLLRGLVERVYFVVTSEGLGPPPKPSPGLFAATLQEFKNQITRRLPRSRPVDYNKFVEYYRGRKKAIYQRAVESLVATPVRRVDAWIKAFVKAEKINFSSKPDPAPRLIQPRSPRYNAAVGVYLRPLEAKVYAAIAAVWGGYTVLKGMNAAQMASALRGMWEQFSNPIAIGLDASRFDQHVSADALRWEHEVYCSAFQGAHRAALARLLRWQVKNIGRAYVGEYKVKYSVDGCRMSGDINTSLGNCLLMCGMVWEWARKKGIRCRLANNGDDCVVIMDRSDGLRFVEGLEEWFGELGFTMVQEKLVDTFEQIKFCQTQPVWGGDQWIMCRDPHVAITKDLVSLLPLDQGFRAYCGAIGDSGMAALGGMPIFQELYKSLAFVGKSSRIMSESRNIVGLRYLARGLNRGYRTISPETRVSFALAFGILPDEQRYLEQHLRDHPVPAMPPLLVTPVAQKWCK